MIYHNLKNECSSVQVEIPEPTSSGILAYTQEHIHDYGLLERETRPHVTIRYGIVTSDVEEVAAALGKFIPIRIMLGHTSIFTADGFRNSDVIKLNVFGESLRRIRRRLTDRLKVVETYTSFEPHVTLAFVEPGHGMKYVGSNPFYGEKLIVSQVVFSPPKGEKHVIKNDGSIHPYTGTIS